MKVHTIVEDNEHGLLSVGCANEMLTWKTLRADEKYLLIVRSAFDRDEGIRKNLISGLETKKTLTPGDEFSLPGGMTAYFYEKGEIAGYYCAVKPARYSVFVCGYTNGSDEVTLYLDSKFIDVSMDVALKRIISTEKKGPFYRREIITMASFSLNNGASFPIGYIDGALYYRFNSMNYKFPISAEMLKVGFKVPAYGSDIPEICSNSMGFIGKVINGG